MSYKDPEFTPLCNRHLRFFLSNPKRLDFQSSVAERQFRAVEQVLADAPPEELERLKLIMLSPDRTRDLCDSYIGRTMRSLNYSDKEVDAFYQQLRAIKNRINAIQELASADNSPNDRLDQIQRVITEREQSGFQYDDSIVRQMIECIKVYPDGKLEIIFGGGYIVEESITAE